MLPHKQDIDAVHAMTLALTDVVTARKMRIAKKGCCVDLKIVTPMRDFTKI
eukprot:TRINITY_DN10902_c1_g1_i1.p2 TRINITY_DN10902_c1_g1~~TRINITY_DN10902_c1_g1_i1.p2  ORF type:complete len:51 (+),score=7.48 TRINITY_DN10902_c1_g1_i1:67-219(+)